MVPSLSLVFHTGLRDLFHSFTSPTFAMVENVGKSRAFPAVCRCFHLFLFWVTTLSKVSHGCVRKENVGETGPSFPRFPEATFPSPRQATVPFPASFRRQEQTNPHSSPANLKSRHPFMELATLPCLHCNYATISGYVSMSGVRRANGGRSCRDPSWRRPHPVCSRVPLPPLWRHRRDL